MVYKNKKLSQRLVKIGNGTFIGSGVVIKQGIKIGNNCVVRANTFVSKDLKNNELFIR